MDFGWMNWEEILPYKEQLAELEVVLMREYHYPDYPLESARRYCKEKVDELEQHMRDGNTFFWGVREGATLVGYYWAYIAPFLKKKRWHIRSIMVHENYRHMGIGSIALAEGLRKAEALGCRDSTTMYVPWNEDAANAYQRAGYEISRIEVICNLENGMKCSRLRQVGNGGGYVSRRLTESVYCKRQAAFIDCMLRSEQRIPRLHRLRWSA